MKLLGIGIAIVALIGFGTFGMDLHSSKGVIELSKEESLTLMDLRYKSVSAQMDLQEFVNRLALQYGVSLETHDLNAQNGTFFPKTTTEEANE